MNVGILQVGQVAPEVLVGIQDGLTKIFPDTTYSIIKDLMPLPESAFDNKRKQYSSNLILKEVRTFADKREDLHRVLGIVDTDIFVPGLNYVFGEAYAPGKVALISLWRLKPEFYKDNANDSLYLLRALKEAVHELGHTFSLKHCLRRSCVMHFSSSIFDTDKKQSLLCDDCYLKAAIAITNIG